jgi:hypothetical protein
MMALQVANKATMSSTELLVVLNKARTDHGETEVRRNDFTARIRDELDGDHYEPFVVTNPNGTRSMGAWLTLDQCLLVLMRESKAVRRQALDIIKSKTAAPAVALPNFTDPAEAAIAWASQYKAAQQAQIERDEAIKTKALIGSKREASAMATASAAKREANKLRDALGFNARHATVKAVEKATKAKYEWRPLRKYCDEHGLPATYVTDPLYGEVRAWPAGAWADVHGVDIAELFGEAA